MNRCMNRIVNKTIIAAIISLHVFSGCKKGIDNSEKSTNPGIPVTVSPVRTGKMVTYLYLNATSAFLFNSIIKAPVTGFIENIMVSQGDRVDRNQLLFTIRTKESAALRADTLNNLRFSGIVNVKSVTSGQISSIQHPKGDYVAESDELCQIALPGSLVFILDVPFELSGYVRLNSPCEIILPDSVTMNGAVRSRFPAMMSNSQTVRFIVELATPKNLPENLVGKIRIIKEMVKDAKSLPKSCILTDETMQSFWVMKLINDSMAVKVPVTTGISETEFVQVIRPVFDPSDRFLSSGNYGLGDTAYVKVIKSTLHDK
jgi:hypothetical protein